MEGRLTAVDLACRRGERVLFRGLGFDVRGGEALHVAGPNGVGKTSLLRILAGLLRPLAGTVACTVPAALLDQHLPLDGHLPLGKALAFWHRLDAGRDDPGAMRIVGLDPLAEVPVRYLSTGQRRRAAILASNTHKAGLWLLDEPLSGLDRNAAADFQGQLRGWLQLGGMAVIASHQPLELLEPKRIALADFAP